MDTNKKITLPAKIIQPLPFKKKNSPTLSPLRKKSQFSQKQHPHHPPPPKKKNQPLKSHGNYTCSLSTL